MADFMLWSKMHSYHFYYSIFTSSSVDSVYSIFLQEDPCGVDRFVVSQVLEGVLWATSVDKSVEVLLMLEDGKIFSTATKVVGEGAGVSGGVDAAGDDVHPRWKTSQSNRVFPVWLLFVTLIAFILLLLLIDARHLLPRQRQKMSPFFSVIRSLYLLLLYIM